MREAGASFKVTKNRLARLALKDTKFNGLADRFVVLDHGRVLAEPCVGGIGVAGELPGEEFGSEVWGVHEVTVPAAAWTNPGIKLTNPQLKADIPSSP